MGLHRKPETELPADVMNAATALYLSGSGRVYAEVGGWLHCVDLDVPMTMPSAVELDGPMVRL